MCCGRSRIAATGIRTTLPPRRTISSDAGLTSSRARTRPASPGPSCQLPPAPGRGANAPSRTPPGARRSLRRPALPGSQAQLRRSLSDRSGRVLVRVRIPAWSRRSSTVIPTRSSDPDPALRPSKGAAGSHGSQEEHDPQEQDLALPLRMSPRTPFPSRRVVDPIPPPSIHAGSTLLATCQSIQPGCADRHPGRRKEVIQISHRHDRCHTSPKPENPARST